ncbi:hypothetical protein BS47DRAFT_191648 [Hydnum rufescens UP504]|uniref:Secreted protein n=1 Tax=Hydnum rufescens UP504 TaxID=1448309 RepID=A0A9P6DPF3_9AGAM|nr:hypothetical protein BS47DRAFT_191648 [Hydnum rufescens UP504]
MAWVTCIVKDTAIFLLCVLIPACSRESLNPIFNHGFQPQHEPRQLGPPRRSTFHLLHSLGGIRGCRRAPEMGEKIRRSWRKIPRAP